MPYLPSVLYAHVSHQQQCVRKRMRSTHIYNSVHVFYTNGTQQTCRALMMDRAHYHNIVASPFPLAFIQSTHITHNSVRIWSCASLRRRHVSRLTGARMCVHTLQARSRIKHTHTRTHTHRAQICWHTHTYGIYCAT